MIIKTTITVPPLEHDYTIDFSAPSGYRIFSISSVDFANYYRISISQFYIYTMNLKLQSGYSITHQQNIRMYYI